MKFISLTYGIFLLLGLGLYWWFPLQQQKLWIIIILGVLFYASFQLQYIPLLLIILGVNFIVGKILLESQIIEYKTIQDNLDDQYQTKWLPRGTKQRQLVLIFGIVFNILLLIFAKYIAFILSWFYPFNAQVIQDNITWIKRNFFPPIGISFLTFESIAYLIDVYKGTPATGNILKYAAYKAYFPKLISGPITHYHEFAKQLNSLKFPLLTTWVEGLWLITSGAIKKTLIADNLATFVNLTFTVGNFEKAGSLDLWLALFAYSWQLYLDFSGYVDIVRGSSLLFGITLPENFNFPYLSTSIASFWRRWHITLGNWLKNYIYFPLGGSQINLFRTCLNLLILMLISGIWHGADWGYLLWGLLHGLALIIHRINQVIGDRLPLIKSFWLTIPGIIFAWSITQLTVLITWLFFRVPNLPQSTAIFQRLWGYTSDPQFIQKVYLDNLKINSSQLTIGLLLLSLSMGVIYLGQKVIKIEVKWPAKLVLMPIFLYVVWLLSPQGALPYIYFDF